MPSMNDPAKELHRTDSEESPPCQISAEAFLLAEYGALRREIELVIKDIGDYLRYAILSSGAIWHGCFHGQRQSHHKRTSHILAFSSPCGFRFAFFFRPVF